MIRNKSNVESVAICVMVGLLGFAAQARTFEFKRLNPTGLCDNSSYCWGPRRLRYSIKIGGRPWAVLVAWEDCRSEMPKASEFAAAGMWADREDLSDPTAYVGKLRARRTFA